MPTAGNAEGYHRNGQFWRRNLDSRINDQRIASVIEQERDGAMKLVSQSRIAFERFPVSGSANDHPNLESYFHAGKDTPYLAFEFENKERSEMKD
jgi:hypothetical protein